MLTMSLKPIIVAAGLDPNDYKEAQTVTIILLDDDDSVVSDENIKFHKPLFEEFPSSLELFKKFLSQLDISPPTSPINFKIGEFVVIGNYRTPQAATFIRKLFMDPLDYSD